MMECKNILRYILVALLVGVVLKYTPGVNLDDRQILTIIVLSLILFSFLNTSTMEKMEAYVDSAQGTPGYVTPASVMGCGLTVRPPSPPPPSPPSPSPVAQESPESCDMPIRIPHPYLLQSEHEDHSASFLEHDHNKPVQPQLQKGEFSERIAPTDRTNEIIDRQRYNLRFNTPGYYLANNGSYSDGNVPYDLVEEITCDSKMHDLYHQHNHFKWSPHTHIGKARGYIIPNLI